MANVQVHKSVKAAEQHRITSQIPDDYRRFYFDQQSKAVEEGRTKDARYWLYVPLYRVMGIPYTDEEEEMKEEVKEEVKEEDDSGAYKEDDSGADEKKEEVKKEVKKEVKEEVKKEEVKEEETQAETQAECCYVYCSWHDNNCGNSPD